ncbi:MAG TPA: anaerobic C4-dicarboxylate transporter [Telmatospirillum sp.]|nr:anaerobic C4-dicarboxylate transporter [Telmatospirillum sp.]
MVQFWIQFVLVLGAILIGIRRGSIALGLLGGFGVTVLTIGFHNPPANPPIDVMLIILAVVTASATLQVAGGLDWMVQRTERLLRAHPKRVTILAPLCTFFLTMCVGTGHAVYSLLPVIADVALKTKIRPERPMGVASVASQMGITASPVAAAVTSFMALSAKNGDPATLIDILSITIPSGIVGVLVAALWSMNRGKDLDKDPVFLDRLKDPAFRAALEQDVTTLGKTLPKAAPLSVCLFFGGILLVVILALFPALLPHYNGKMLPLTTVVQIVMMSAGALILFSCNVKSSDVGKSGVFTAGMTAVIAIFGIAWMSDCFVSGNQDFLIRNIKEMVQYAPWTFALAMFAVSAFVKSQAAVLVIMMPFGYTLGLSTHQMLAVIPSCYAYFFFCFYPSDLASISMDRTGTTNIGTYLLNHSFMIPGLLGVSVSTVVAYGLSVLLF